MQTVALNLNSATVGTRYSKGRKYAPAIMDILKNPNATAVENMRALQALSYFYYPAYCKRNHKPVRSDWSGLPFEACKPMDLSALSFCDVGEWLMQLSTGLTNTGPKQGPSESEMQWIFNVVAKRTAELQKATEEFLKD